MDGPVVRAAIRALDARDVDLVLPYVKEGAEEEIRRSFALVVAARGGGAQAREVADRYFFDTVVRVHRAGEGAAFTGVKPAGLPVGPVIPIAERAIATGSADDLLGLLEDALRDEVKERLERVLELQIHADGPVPHAREYVEAMLGLQVWANGIFGAIRSTPHGQGTGEHGD
ncbi:MAG TPA: DUF6448 family protein [Actinomycetota bacterium]|nr:DUF6448 family protein [Actinomycetota bacterium]